MRKTSLEELPQLWNVLKGDMSFVGARPVTRGELQKYGAYEWAYLRNRPGITGLWQVSGRNDVSYDERVALDASYARDCGLVGDIMIILKTAKSILARTGK